MHKKQVSFQNLFEKQTQRILFYSLSVPTQNLSNKKAKLRTYRLLKFINYKYVILSFSLSLDFLRTYVPYPHAFDPFYHACDPSSVVCLLLQLLFPRSLTLIQYQSSLLSPWKVRVNQCSQARQKYVLLLNDTLLQLYRTPTNI